MDTEQRAARARRLLTDEHFQSLVQEIQDDATRAFLNADDPSSEEVRAHHALSRAVKRIRSKLQADLDAETKLKKRRGQDREHD